VLIQLIILMMYHNQVAVVSTAPTLPLDFESSTTAYTLLILTEER
jgi:hypothetical protein